MIDDVSLTQIGAVVSLQGRNIGSNIWVDESANDLPGTITGASALYNQRHLYLDDSVAGSGDSLLSVGTSLNLLKNGIDRD